MKILLATSFFPPTHTAGTEKRTFGYAKTLLARGHTVQVVCVGDWEKGEQYWNGHTDENYQGIPVRRIHLNWLKSPNPNGYLYNNPVIARYFDQWLAEWQPDVVHITSCLTLSASIIPAAKKRGLPVVLTLTDFWFVCHRLSLLKYDGTLCDGCTTSMDCTQCINWDTTIFQKILKFSSAQTATLVLHELSKIPAISRHRGLRGTALDINQRKAYLSEMLSMADIVTAPSNHLSDTLKASGVAREIQVIQSGHDLSWLASSAPKEPGPRLRLGYIGQFIQTKGVHTLLEAFGGQDWQGKTELHLFGDQEASPEYWLTLQKIEIKNQDSIYFHGPFPHEKLGEILAGIDILIVPSLWHENNPRVIQEAFASKTPVIASNVGGIAEYVTHKVNGYLFERGSSIDLGQVLQEVVNDISQLEQVRANIPNVKSIYNEVDEIEKIYHQMLLR